MRSFRNYLAVCVLAAPLFVAAQENPPSTAPQSEHEHAAPPAGAAAGDHSMANMHEHMQQMRDQMARIHATEDPVERQRLMHEHMQSMQQHMQMMGSMRSEQHVGGASRCAEGDAACRMEEMRAENGMMRDRMSMMEGKLEAMQQLMREMMEHLDEAEGGGAP